MKRIYGVFKFCAPDEAKKFYKVENCNRPIIPGQVTKLVKSIQKIGVVRPVIVCRVSFIDGVKRTYIIDGQHLQTGCLRLGLGFPYVEIAVKDKAELVEIMALLNSSSKSWAFKDYVTAWSSLDDKEDYRKLLHYNKTYDMTLDTLATVFSNCGRRETSDRIKKGTYKIVNEKKGKEILDNLNDIFKGLNRGSAISVREFVLKFTKWRYITDKYNHKKFLDYVLKNKDLVNGFIYTEEEAFKFFERFK